MVQKVRRRLSPTRGYGAPGGLDLTKSQTLQQLYDEATKEPWNIAHFPVHARAFQWALEGRWWEIRTADELDESLFETSLKVEKLQEAAKVSCGSILFLCQ